MEAPGNKKRKRGPVSEVQSREDGPAVKRTSVDHDHLFLVPSSNVTVPKSKKRATEEQLRQTESCRAMRKAVVEVILEVHDEIEKYGKPVTESVSDLMENLWICWGKYPLMFASLSKIPKIYYGDDLSPVQEIKDFMSCWLHGLSSLILYPELEAYSKDLLRLLQAFVQMVAYGNPELLEIYFVQFVQAISNLVKDDCGGCSKVDVHFPDYKDDAVVKTFQVSYKLPSNMNSDALCDLLDILGMFLPHVFYFSAFRHEHQYELLRLLHELWTRLDSKCKFKLLTKFVVPVIPLFSSFIVSAEASLANFCSQVISDGMVETDLFSLAYFNQFCTLIWKRFLSLDSFPRSFVLRLHSYVAKILASEEFHAIASESRRAGIVKLYLALTESNEVGGIPLNDIDSSAFLRASKTLPAIEFIHPMLERSIFKEVRDIFERRCDREIEKMWKFHPNKSTSKHSTRIILDKACSWTWQKLSSDFESLVKIDTINDETDALMRLRRSCFLIQLASRVNTRLINNAMRRNRSRKLILIPDLQFLNGHMLTNWTNFVEKIVIYIFSEPEPKEGAEEAICLILDAIQSFHSGLFLEILLPIDVITKLVCITGVPWLSKFKYRLPLECSHLKVLDGVENASFVGIEPSVIAKCLSTLSIPLFYTFKDFVFIVIYSVIKELKDVQVAKSFLKLVSEENWVIKSFSWNFLIVTIHRITSTFNWQEDAELRKALSQAITRLPCIYAGHKLVMDEKCVKTQLLMEPCPCSVRLDQKYTDYSESTPDSKSEDLNLVPVPEVALDKIIQLALPLLRSKFMLVKLELAKLISVSKLHSEINQYNQQLILEFTRIAANGYPCIGEEIMRQFSFYFKPNEKTFLFQEYLNSDERFGGISLMFNTLLYELYNSYVAKCSVRFAAKMFIILKGLARNADRLMIVEVLKYSIRLLLHRDSNVRILLSQTLCAALASCNQWNENCQPWELMIRLRYELAPGIIETLREEFCNWEDFDPQLQSERACAFLHGICQMGEFRQSSVFKYHYFPIFLAEASPFLATDERYRFILKCISEFGNEPETQILQSSFPSCYRYLVLNFPHERPTRIFKYLEEVYRLPLVFLATNAIQSTVNELLCYLSESKDKVIKYIPPLFTEDEEFTVSTPSRSEIREVLQKHLMGFLVHVDTKMHSRLESVQTKRRILQSLIVLMMLMGKKTITQYKSKLYTTLNSLFSLGAGFYDLAYESWRSFSMCLEDAVFGPMCVQIIAAVSTLHEFLPQKVENLIKHFVHTMKELTFPYYKELYFVTDFTNDPLVLKPIKACIEELSQESWVQFLALVVNETSSESSHVRARSVKKLSEILVNEYNQVKCWALDREHPVVAQLLSSLFNASRDADRSTLMLLAESFGNLGAVDPFRFKNKEDEEIRRKSTPVLTVVGMKFALKYLNVLIRELQEAVDTTDFDYCACLIQQLFQHFDVKNNDRNYVWSCLSKASKDVVEPLFTSKYRVEKPLPRLNMTSPIYGTEAGKTFDQWVSNWLACMVSNVEPGTKAYDVFQFSKYMVPRNYRVASFLLPYVATYAAVDDFHYEQNSKIVREMNTILQTWIEQDRFKSNSQRLIAVKESQTEMGTPGPEPKIVYDEDVIQYRCTQEVFSVFDHLFRAVRDGQRRGAILSAQRKHVPMILPHPSDSLNPPLEENQTKIVAKLLEKIPMTLLSQVAFLCEDYKRALFYAEQYLKRDPYSLQQQINYLQQLYLSLDDLDSVVGVSVVRQKSPTRSEVVTESYAKRDIESGVRSLEKMVSEDPNDLIAASGLLQAYLSLDEPRKAETLIKGCVSRNPHWEVALEEFQTEATWKLNEWDKLHDKVKYLDGINGGSTSSLKNEKLEILPPWTNTIVKLLSSIQRLDIEPARTLLNETRLKLMNPLVAAANDHNAYARSYASIVQLHILREVEQVIDLINDRESPSFNLIESITKLIGSWTDRESVLLQSQKYLDAVLNVRKSLLELLKDMSFGEAGAKEILSGSIRNCWLTAARVESKTGNFTRASNCISEAAKYMSAKVMLEDAKLQRRKGDKLQALKAIQNNISKYFPLVEEWKGRVPPSTEESEDRKLCSQALLLQSKLSDELQLLDIEKNIQNYESCINVFKKCEKNHFTLAGYYERLCTKAEVQSVQGSTYQEKIVKAYAQSLHYGCKYVYQSLPRLLSIWFDFASIGLDVKNDSGKRKAPVGGTRQKEQDKKNAESQQPPNWTQIVNNMNGTIRTLIKEVPAYVLLTAFSQLISRLCHANPNVWELLKEVIGSIICTHPHQALWMTIAVSKSSYEMRKSRCMEIYKWVEIKKPELRKTIEDYIRISGRLMELCVKEHKDSKRTLTASLSALCKELPFLIRSPSFGDVLIPFQVFLNPSLPPNGGGHKSYDAFPQKFVFIRGVEDEVTIMQSLVSPKRISLIGSDGKRYGLLCKARDDLRKDCKVMEVNNVVNWYLHRNAESRQRQLYVRLYAVTPLNEQHGLLEWVPNLSGLRANVLTLYKERGIKVSMKDLLVHFNLNDPLEVALAKFRTHLLQPHPPVLYEWFLNNFNDCGSWYKARMSFVRTTAVMSIVGFVLGLGDRHGENILLDSSCGDLVHVDFNCLFNLGETFDVPERVPFRLTQNMVDAMGPLGVEGVFRRSCEITMSLFREHLDVFLSVLRPFVFDPLVEWKESKDPKNWRPAQKPQQPSKPISEYNYMLMLSVWGWGSNGPSSYIAMEHLLRIRNRINGSARNNTQEVNSELSVEAQVAYLIDEARSYENLCRMFLGWTSFI